MALALALIASVVLSVTPKHGTPYSTYVISFKAPYATSKAAGTDYGIGAVNSGSCTRGISSFGRIQYGPYKKGQTVRFVILYLAKGESFFAGYERRQGGWERLDFESR